MLRRNIFGPASTAKGLKLHRDLWIVCQDVLAHLDISILCSTRDEATQTKEYLEGDSLARFSESPHNYAPSFAADVGIWDSELQGVREDPHSCKLVRDCFETHAIARGIDLEFGYDWSFKDAQHIELKGWRTVVSDTDLVG